MNSTLKEALAVLETASPDAQEQVAFVIYDIVQQDAEKKQRYSQPVEDKLAKGQADIAAGRVTPIASFMTDFKADMRSKYGSL